MENKDLKQIIDAELTDLVVTNSLKQKTLEKIHSPKKPLFRNFYHVKLSLVSSLLVVMITGFNLIIPRGKDTPITNTLSIPNSREAFPEADFSPSDKKTTTTTTTTSPIENQEKGR